MFHRPDGAGARGHQAVAGKLIRAFVHGVAGVAFDPVPVHLVMVERRVEPLP